LRFRFGTPASRDLLRLHAFLAPLDPDAAARAMQTINQAIRGLDQFPDHGRPVSDGARELIVPFGAGEYIVLYRHIRRAREIAILRIWHSRENRA
jgi:plasmid stabilization system protein ParE